MSRATFLFLIRFADCCLILAMLTPGVVAALTGLLAHHLVFIHGEWHLRAPIVVVIHLLLAGLLYGCHLALSLKDWPVRSARATVLVGSYLASLYLSIAIYRLCFHRLRHFPGPPLAALTKLWHVWKCRHSRGHFVLEAWHQQYGSFVRTGGFSSVW